MKVATVIALAAILLTVRDRPPEKKAAEAEPLYTYKLKAKGDAASYDEAMAAATLQGIINRKAPRLYFLSEAHPRPQFWLDIFRGEGRWLAGRKIEPLADIGSLVRLAGEELRGAVIWDPAVPATVNVATTLAGVEDLVVLSPTLAGSIKLPIVHDLRGKFDGRETGSAKNDAYRWAIREYLTRDRCSSRWLFLNEDSSSQRGIGNFGDVATRDWAVKNRAFVFDLSPWGDEVPADDPSQKLGTDLETYRQILEQVARMSSGREMTELAGFFSFAKYSNVPGHASTHDPVPTEWETVWLISPFNCYQNTATSGCFNQSLHSQAPRRQLAQRRLTPKVDLKADRTYISILMADYDSSMPLYEFLPQKWSTRRRGELPLSWGINPNLLDTFPDIVSHFYGDATPNDLFTADASAAGYLNPNRILPEHLPLFVRHNQKYFQEADMTIAPMILDWDEPSGPVKDAFREFAPDGLAALVADFHNKGGRPAQTHLWKGMPVTELVSEGWGFGVGTDSVERIHDRIARRPPGQPGFILYRIVWMSPDEVAAIFDRLKAQHPEDRFEIIDMGSYFKLLGEHLEARSR